MKIAILVTCFTDRNVPVGGHYNTVAVLAGALSFKADVLVLALGDQKPIRLEKLPFFEFISMENRGDKRGRTALIDRLSAFNPSVVNTFDHFSHDIGKQICYLNRWNLVITKPGGKVPRFVHRKASDIILFHEEDVDWFSRTPFFRSSRLHLVPNRCAEPEFNSCDPELRKMIESKVPISGFRFLLISRICKEKLPQFTQSINLVEELSRRGKNVHLILVGVPEDNDALREVQNASSSSTAVSLFTDDALTADGPRLIPLADFVVGMGRGVMEGCALGRPVLVCTQQGPYPELLSDRNYATAAKHNFSLRMPATITSSEECIQEVCSILDDASKYKKAQEDARLRFERDFSIYAVVETYLKIYCQSRPPGHYLFEKEKQRLLSVISDPRRIVYAIKERCL